MKTRIMSLIITLILAAVTLLSIDRIVSYDKEIKRLKANEQFRDTTYLRMSGGTTTYGDNGFDNPILNYDLRSWDAGKNWYAVDYNFDTDEFKILGEAEKIYPGLIENIKSWNTMMEYVEMHGPIDLNDSKGVKVMESAGFTVSKK